MTNFEHYKEKFTVDILVNRSVMDCRACPLPHPTRGVCCLTRKECEKRIRDWCSQEYNPEEDNHEKGDN